VHAEQAEAVAEGDNVRWFVADDVPELAFDHSGIVEYALWRLRNKMEYSRIAHALLGETFTLSQLRHVHEAVLRRPLDPANFRRQIEASGSIVATEAVVTGGRHRPPRLYRYDDNVDMADNGPLVLNRTPNTQESP
jgi:8-oxo-dGTP diphosphatase